MFFVASASPSMTENITLKLISHVYDASRCNKKEQSSINKTSLKAEKEQRIFSFCWVNYAFFPHSFMSFNSQIHKQSFVFMKKLSTNIKTENKEKISTKLKTAKTENLQSSQHQIKELCLVLE
jgi:hypothetical protein